MRSPARQITETRICVALGFDSESCGSCWNLTFEDHFIIITAIDHASPGFNIGLQAMNNLTGNLAEELGRINATALELDESFCGLPVS